MPIDQKPDVWGRVCYHTQDPISNVRMNKTSLGDFTYTVLSHGGDIYQLWPFNIKYKNTVVYASVKLTPEAKEEIEKTTKYRFKLPPKVEPC